MSLEVKIKTAEQNLSGFENSQTAVSDFVQQCTKVVMLPNLQKIKSWVEEILKSPEIDSNEPSLVLAGLAHLIQQEIGGFEALRPQAETRQMLEMIELAIGIHKDLIQEIAGIAKLIE